MLHLPRHDGPVHAFLLERVDQLRKLSQRQPVDCRRSARRNVGKSLFLDRCHDHLVTLRARGIENQKGELAVAGDQAELFVRGRH